MTPLAQAIARFEGYYTPGTVAARNNNPGNLKYAGQPGAIGADRQGYAIFRTASDGWAALERQIQLDAGRGHTLSTFLHKYAPAAENPTGNYIRFVSATLGVPADIPLSTIAAAPTVSAPPAAAGKWKLTPVVDWSQYAGAIWIAGIAAAALLLFSILDR